MEAARALAARGRILAAVAALPGDVTVSGEDRSERDSLIAEASRVRAALEELQFGRQAAAAAGAAAVDKLLVSHAQLRPRVHDVCVEGVVSSPATDLLAIAREWDLVETWNDFLSDTCIGTHSLASIVHS